MEKKYVVITGASSGIGKATAFAFAKRGKHLILVARRKKELKEIKKLIQKEYPDVDVIPIVADLTNIQELPEFYHSLDTFQIEAWINNAGIGMYGEVADQSVFEIEHLLRLNVEALTILSALYVQDYKNAEGAQLINVSSAGGYTIVPTAIVYCASKFYVSSFTEGLSKELSMNGYKMKAKVLAPAATETEFGKIANKVKEYDYDTAFKQFHTSEEMADFLCKLYDSEATVGYVDRTSFQLELSDNRFEDAFHLQNNQSIQ